MDLVDNVLTMDNEKQEEIENISGGKITVKPTLRATETA